MIKTFEQAMAVQERRVKAKKRGYAKSVRRWIRLEAILMADEGDGKTFAIADYHYMQQRLPVLWNIKKKEDEPEPESTLQDQIRAALGVEV